MRPPANLAHTHPHYRHGFPAAAEPALYGHYAGARGVVVVEPHPHGFEVHLAPCYDFAACDACSPDRGSSNPHTLDGHDFRACSSRGPILTVAGDRPEVVRAYLEQHGIAGDALERARLRA